MSLSRVCVGACFADEEEVSNISLTLKVALTLAAQKLIFISLEDECDYIC